MPFINWIFLMNLHQSTRIIVNLLIKADRKFRCVHFLYISCCPAMSPLERIRIHPAAIRKVFPDPKFLFILSTSTCFQRAKYPSLRQPSFHPDVLFAYFPIFLSSASKPSSVQISHGTIKLFTYLRTSPIPQPLAMILRIYCQEC